MSGDLEEIFAVVQSIASAANAVATLVTTEDDDASAGDMSKKYRPAEGPSAQKTRRKSNHWRAGPNVYLLEI